MKVIEYIVVPAIIFGMVIAMIYKIAALNAQERLYKVPVINVI